MTAEKLERLRGWAQKVNLQEVIEVIDMLREVTRERNALREKAHNLDVQRARAEWQAQGLEIERDALRARVAELEQAERLRDEALAGRG